MEKKTNLKSYEDIAALDRHIIKKTFTMSDEFECLLLEMANIGKAVLSLTVEVNFEKGVWFYALFYIY